MNNSKKKSAEVEKFTLFRQRRFCVSGENPVRGGSTRRTASATAAFVS
jgi:hypothetical protein